jgi:hypothetical protein
MHWPPRFLRRIRATALPAAPALVLSSVTAAAALAQRLTGDGSGPYSGTPFRLVPVVAADGQRAPGVGELCEAARRDHGIIDHSRHVSSIGRR